MASEFGKRLKEAFGNAGNAEIARKLDVSEPAVSTYLNGRTPPADTLINIAKITNCDLHWLLTGERNEKLQIVNAERSLPKIEESSPLNGIDMMFLGLEDFEKEGKDPELLKLQLEAVILRSELMLKNSEITQRLLAAKEKERDDYEKANKQLTFEPD
jgi:transcriptional regulator with XRE-family HTH domain